MIPTVDKNSRGWVSSIFCRRLYVCLSHLIVESLHIFNVQWFEAVPRWRDEVEADVDAGVGQADPVDPGLGVQERLVLWLDVVDDGLPAVGVVHGVPEAGCVHDGEGEVHAGLLQQDFVGVNLDRREKKGRRKLKSVKCMIQLLERMPWNSLDRRKKKGDESEKQRGRLSICHGNHEKGVQAPVLVTFQNTT